MSLPSMVTTLLWGEALPPLGLNFLICEMRGWDHIYVKPLCISLIWQRGFFSQVWRGAPGVGVGGSLLSMARMWPGQGVGRCGQEEALGSCALSEGLHTRSASNKRKQVKSH